MAREIGKAPFVSDELLGRIGELCQQVTERCEIQGIFAPQPRDVAREMRALAIARKDSGLPMFRLDVVQATFFFMVPPSQR